MRAHNETGALTITASPSFVGEMAGAAAAPVSGEIPAVDVRISTSDKIVDLTPGDFDLAIRYGTGRYPGLDVELLLKNEVFPACSPRLLETGPPLRTPDDLRHHTLIHDTAADRYPLAPTWPMWLKAAGVEDMPATAGLTFTSGTWRWMRRSPGTASCSPTARSRRPTSRRGGCAAVLAEPARPVRVLHRHRAGARERPKVARSATGCARRRIPAAGSVPEVADSGEHHRDPGPVGGFDNFRVAARAAGLDCRGGAGPIAASSPSANG